MATPYPILDPSKFPTRQAYLEAAVKYKEMIEEQERIKRDELRDANTPSLWKSVGIPVAGSLAGFGLGGPAGAAAFGGIPGAYYQHQNQKAELAAGTVGNEKAKNYNAYMPYAEGAMYAIPGGGLKTLAATSMLPLAARVAGGEGVKAGLMDAGEFAAGGAGLMGAAKVASKVAGKAARAVAKRVRRTPLANAVARPKLGNAFEGMFPPTTEAEAARLLLGAAPEVAPRVAAPVAATVAPQVGRLGKMAAGLKAHPFTRGVLPLGLGVAGAGAFMGGQPKPTTSPTAAGGADWDTAIEAAVSGMGDAPASRSGQMRRAQAPRPTPSPSPLAQLPVQSGPPAWMDATQAVVGQAPSVPTSVQESGQQPDQWREMMKVLAPLLMAIYAFKR